MNIRKSDTDSVDVRLVEAISAGKCPMCVLRQEFDELTSDHAQLRSQYHDSAMNYETLRKRVGRLLSDAKGLEGLGTLAGASEEPGDPVAAPTSKPRRKHRAGKKSWVHRGLRTNHSTSRDSFKSAQDIIGGRKLCALCHKDFPATLEFFHASRKAHTGMASWCKPCNNTRQATYDKTHRKSATLRHHSVDESEAKS